MYIVHTYFHELLVDLAVGAVQGRIVVQEELLVHDRTRVKDNNKPKHRKSS